MSSAKEKSDSVELGLPSTIPLLPQPGAPKPRDKRATYRNVLFIWLLVLAGLQLYHQIPALFRRPGGGAEADAAKLCPQVAELTPEKNGKLWTSLGETYGTETFKTRAIDWLGGAVRVPTESYDSMEPVGVDPRWEVFAPFHDYLLQAFPLVHTTLALTKVNTYGLVYEWKGSDASLKPVLLAAHQDVVPVHPDTVDEWVHPPFSGYFDGERLWGRGSNDDKSGLIGIMASFETLIESGFKPTRGIVLASGFDEEASGLHGARSLGTYLEETFGENGFSILVDEGAGYQETLGGVFATPGVGEKGYIDVQVEVTAPGGHSSIPPAHTSIGMLSALLVKLEDNPITSRLARNTPIYDTIQCLAAHAPAIPRRIKKAVARSAKSDRALHAVESYFFDESKTEEGSRNALGKLAGTTQAIDLIQGGVKTNALPERVWAVINHRIATDSSVATVRERDTSLFKSLASSFNLSYTAFGSQISPASPSSAYGTLTLSDAFANGLEPAPITPTSGGDAEAYKLLSGTIKATYNAHRSIEGDNIVVAPGIMSGNTDTRYYWKLTRNIFRYNHHNGGKGGALLGGVHTVNESIEIDSFLEVIRFFTTLVLNADESTAL